MSVRAPGAAETVVTALSAPRKPRDMVQAGMLAGRHVIMTPPVDPPCSEQLVVCTTRGTPARKYPAPPNLLGSHDIDLSPLITRTITLGGASAELAVFDHPAPPGVAVITDFTA